MRKVNYNTGEERETLLNEAEARGEYLIEDAILLNEKYLIFDTAPPQAPQPTPDEITAQTIAQLALENADLKAQVQTLAQTVAQLLLK
ncbi:hypothetical protein [Caldanaerobius polysaccharolyticus]|uniref:hypothetical protein n=1 Tax=Caldanaerobius polysaccharolyticus TaxID=44256 RepID=UPI00047D5A32|nr:hypothetical protein [Caldanaerobius polysaccharolyticus]